jgi:hypothetical protein
VGSSNLFGSNIGHTGCSSISKFFDPLQMGLTSKGNHTIRLVAKNKFY